MLRLVQLELLLYSTCVCMVVAMSAPSHDTTGVTQLALVYKLVAAWAKSSYLHHRDPALPRLSSTLRTVYMAGQKL